MTKRNRTITVVGVGILLILGGFFFFGRTQNEPYEFVLAKRGDIVQEVSVTGRVTPARAVALAFEKSGKIEKITVEVGDEVAQGATLVALDRAELFAELREAEAEVAAGGAELNKANITLANFYEESIDVMQTAYTNAQEAIVRQLDELFSEDEYNPKLTFETNNSQLEVNIEAGRTAANVELGTWQRELGTLTKTASPQKLEDALRENETRLNFLRNLLDEIIAAVNGAIGLSQSTVTAYKTNAFSARTSVNADLGEVRELLQNIRSQEAAVAAQEAAVARSVAGREAIEAQLDAAVLRAPFAGVVTAIEPEVGETTSAATPVLSLISAAEFEIEANIPEVDVAKLTVGDEAAVTLDAYGSDLFFRARVLAIDPAETVIEGVPTYKATFQFLEKDARIKSGMTANIDVVTGRREGVLVIPARAVSTKEGAKFVRILEENGFVSEKEVTLGLRGSDGTVEVLQGLQEGEKVITFLREK